MKPARAPLYDHGIPAPGPSMLRAIRDGRQPLEADVDADVRAEFGRLAQPSLFPSLYVRPNEVGRFIPLSDAIAAVESVFERGGAPGKEELIALLSHRVRVIGIKGSPDLYGSVEGRLFWVELKRPAWRGPDGRLRPGGTLDPDQVVWHRVAHSKGVPVTTIDGPEQCEPFIRALLAAPPPPASPGRRPPTPTP